MKVKMGTIYISKGGAVMAIEMQKLISEYVRAVRKIYGHHLKQVILYGSYARGVIQKIPMWILCCWWTWMKWN